MYKTYIKGEIPMEKSTTPKEVFIDPVCLMKVIPDKPAHPFTYKKHTYFFCAESCRKAFESNPDKYLGQEPPKRKGFFGRYLDRLNKVTGGKSMKCH